MPSSTTASVSGSFSACLERFDRVVFLRILSPKEFADEPGADQPRAVGDAHEIQLEVEPVGVGLGVLAALPLMRWQQIPAPDRFGFGFSFGQLHLDPRLWSRLQHRSIWLRYR